MFVVSGLGADAETAGLSRSAAGGLTAGLVPSYARLPRCATLTVLEVCAWPASLLSF
jgi:hypothetical protein